jgi:hypothetical protein
LAIFGLHLNVLAGLPTVELSWPDGFKVLFFGATYGLLPGALFPTALMLCWRFVCRAPTKAIKPKVEAYIHHLKQRKHEALNIKRIRAVLVETTTDERIAALMTVVAAFAASEPLAGVLFWFATAGKESDSPFSPRWVCAGDSRVRSLLD